MTVLTGIFVSGLAHIAKVGQVARTNALEVMLRVIQ